MCILFSEKETAVINSSREGIHMSRSIGDFHLKQGTSLSGELLSAELQAVTCVPDVVIRPREHQDLFVVIACDGIWDVMENQEVIDFVGNKLIPLELCSHCPGIPSTSHIQEAELPSVCNELLHACFERESTDNMTAIVVVFRLKKIFNMGDAATLQATIKRLVDNNCSPSDGGDEKLFTPMKLEYGNQMVSNNTSDSNIEYGLGQQNDAPIIVTCPIGCLISSEQEQSNEKIDQFTVFASTTDAGIPESKGDQGFEVRKLDLDFKTAEVK